MVKLTPQLIDDAAERTNPVRERELILRGLKFSVIENLGIGLDQYDAYDLCDNDILKFGNFPNLVKCKYIYASNNRIGYIAGDISLRLPNLLEINLINNDIRSLTNIKRLEKCECLKYLSLSRNPVVLEPNYRKFVIYTLKNLKFLDFLKIKERERAEAKDFFENQPEGKAMLAKILAKAKEESEDGLFGEADMEDEIEEEELDEEMPNKKKRRRVKDPSATISTDVQYDKDYETEGSKQLKMVDEEQRAKIKKAILAASSVEEIERLNRMLQAGYIPQEA